MKVTYLKLENVAGLLVGSNRSSIEISFEKSKNKIIAIQAPNGTGKSVLLSSISPFSGVTSVDERSTLNYIVSKKNGYKEIHYQDGDNTYIIKHYYKATKDSHTVKSYFMMNGEEMNENGNVTSFLSLVETHLGLTQEMMRLIRLGTNLNSFIRLSPARRKEYIGKLIEEINVYLKIHKDINDDIRVVKTLISTNSNNLYNCHISDVVVEEEKLAELEKSIKSYEKDKDKIVARIGKIQALISDNDVDELKRKKEEAEVSIREFNKTENLVRERSLENVTVDKLICKRSDLLNERIDIQSKINSYRISIDNTLRSIERLEINIKRITSDNDIQSLTSNIESLRETLKSVSRIIIDFNPMGITSDTIDSIWNKLSSFNQISQMIYTFGNKPIEVYLRLKSSNKSVDKFLKDQMKNISSRVDDNNLKMLFDKVFGDDMIITPNCDTEYEQCPYYRFSELICGIRDKLEEETYDSETLRYIQVISNNIDNILNELDLLINLEIPDIIKESFKEKSILDRMKNHLPFFDLTTLQEYLTIVKEHEIYKQNLERLKQYEYQLSIYKKSGIDSHMEEIEVLRNQISFYRNNIDTLSKNIEKINTQLEDIDYQITLLTKYNDGKKYKKIFESTLESTNKILEPLESAFNEKMELEFSLKQIVNTINLTRESHKQLETKINEYKRLVKEGEELSAQHHDLNIILRSVSTKEGIPVVYMKRYLGRIQKLANNLLKLIYDDDLKLAKFNVTQDTFEVPYVKNGTKISDVKYASQSENAMITMALSFALANRASGQYNILSLDEVDAGLDETNRSAFLKMLYLQMNVLKAEQVFMISHNMTQMINIPMDVIKLADTGITSKLQNIIYE